MTMTVVCDGFMIPHHTHVNVFQIVPLQTRYQTLFKGMLEPGKLTAA